MEDYFEIPKVDLLQKKCTICHKVYVHRKSLYAHLRFDHDLEPRPQRKEFACEMCEKAYCSQPGLKNHVKRSHCTDDAEQINENSAVSVNREPRILCPHETCWEKFSHYKHLRDHILKAHDVEIDLETYEFDSIDDFEFWKLQVQQETTSYYTLDTSSKQLSNGVQKKYFNCHRSYKFKSKGKNIRKLKSCGSIKIGKACPSRMEVTIKNENVQVNFWSSHYGHEVHPCTVPLENDAVLRSHKASLNISREQIEVIREGREWLISSQNGPQKNYVTLIKQTCLEPCLMCKKCNICVHTFKCSCIEHVVKNLICKHIHGIARVFVFQLPITDVQDQESSSSYSAEIDQKVQLISKLCNEVEIDEEKCLLIQNYLDLAIRVLSERLASSLSTIDDLIVHSEPEQELKMEAEKNSTTLQTDQPVLIHSSFDHTYL
ncbi:uncharacterized protein LOC109538690 [Dendroctonus ponderosae]|uniref:C2H2-type domain-containing protein n=1 Tax=Dendroctonus ponderosae TaxID=77166 RepID=A0AAR5PL33_DENPD|nr:uncharacterized protein LOC109538690 [Dendroctonus ponderosae]KAH1013485.1 hypothetical protein HUJ04_002469 [Dendroctonus ponderosae]KAH1024633.1 hypothetical protein HUJ05_004093 [Dendroctonus ponderosae]